MHWVAWDPGAWDGKKIVIMSPVTDRLDLKEGLLGFLEMAPNDREG